MTTPTDYAKLADVIEGLAKDATPGPWFQWPTNDGGRVCALFPVEGEEPLSIADFDMDQRIDYDTQSCANAALTATLQRNIPTIISALRDLEAARAREKELREALEPFAAEANTYDCDDDEEGKPEISDARVLRIEEANGDLSESIITVGDFRRARAALGGAG